MGGHKTCSKCGESKPREQFHKKAKAKDGLQGWCKACAKDRTLQWQRDNAEKKRASYHRWLTANREKAIAATRRWQCNNSERHQEKKRLWERANSAKRLENVRRWGEQNPDKLRELRARMKLRRKAAEKRQTPAWLSPEHITEMRAIYAKAGPGDHVDHIWPIQGKTAWGLHVPWNLQILPARENIRKSNKPPEIAT